MKTAQTIRTIFSIELSPFRRPQCSMAASPVVAEQSCTGRELSIANSIILDN
jgi:hypothetical protein